MADSYAEFVPGRGRVYREGERNDVLFRRACSYRRQGKSEAEIKHALEVLNGNCQPSLDAKELQKIAVSAMRYSVGGPDALKVAWSRVRKTSRGSKYRGFIALAYEVQHDREGFPAALPVARIGELLGCTHVAVSQFRKRAEAMGLMKLAERYSKPMKRAATYVVNLDRAREFLDSVSLVKVQSRTSLVKADIISSESKLSSETFTKPLGGISESTPGEGISQVLRLSSYGLRLFPCRPRGKEPLIREWPDAATCEAEQLSKWAARFPECNWALATGSRSGVFVLDVDGEDGKTSFRELFGSHGALDCETLGVKTSRGVHLYFRWPSDGTHIPNSAGKLGKGLDVRATRGYCLVPPSIHPDGRAYEWLGGRESQAIANAPEWLLYLAIGSKVKASAPAAMPVWEPPTFTELRWPEDAEELKRLGVEASNFGLPRSAASIWGML